MDPKCKQMITKRQITQNTGTQRTEPSPRDGSHQTQPSPRDRSPRTQPSPRDRSPRAQPSPRDRSPRIRRTQPSARHRSPRTHRIQPSAIDRSSDRSLCSQRTQPPLHRPTVWLLVTICSIKGVHARFCECGFAYFESSDH